MMKVSEELPIMFHQRGMDSHYKIWHATGRNMLIYMYSEGGGIVCSEKIYPIRPGVLCFVGAGKYHYTMPDDPKQYDRSKVFLTSDEMLKMLEMFPEKSEFMRTFTEEAFVYARIDEQDRSKVEQLFEEIVEFAEEEEYAGAALYSGYMKLLIYLHKNILEGVSPTAGGMQTAVAYINEHIREDMSIDEICEAAHCSKYHFCRQFKKVTGMTVMNYIRKTRIVMAEAMLLKGDASIGDISERCGFSSMAYFSRVFKEDTGVSPLQYRRTAGGNG